MDIYLHNTLTGKKDVFKPIHENKVGIYSCGPTVYNYAHIGNLRSYVFADVLKRMFEWNEYEVTHIINITDIGHLVSDGDEGEDKMTKALKRENKPLTLEAMKEVAEMYFGYFKEDLKALNIELPQKFPFASDYIVEYVELIHLLTQKGFAYTTSDGIYFDTEKFPNYGKLGNIFQAPESDEQSRIGVNSEKKSFRDFALWKFNNELGFDTAIGSGIGKGFPGWHIECSVMSRQFLGQPFDIHTGGIDHIPTHHNNEIAQSEAAYDTPLANYWMHNEHLNIGAEKIAKSGENFITLNTIVKKGISPLAYRYLLLTARYSTSMQYSLEALEGAQVAWKKLRDRMSSMQVESNNESNMDDIANNVKIETYKYKFTEYINDDLDTPRAIALLWEILKDTEILESHKRSLILDFDRVFGLELGKKETVEIPEEVQKLIDSRDAARAEKDFAQSDELRKQIENLGFDVKDTPDGTQVEAR